MRLNEGEHVLGWSLFGVHEDGSTSAPVPCGNASHVFPDKRGNGVIYGWILSNIPPIEYNTINLEVLQIL